jgi:hypothetical protein
MHKTGLVLFAVAAGFGCVENDADELLLHNQEELEYLPAGAVASLRITSEEVVRNILGGAYSTPVGFAGIDYGLGVAVDGAGNAYLTGTTTTGCGATTAPYLAKFNTSGLNIYFACLPAGTGSNDIAVDGTGNAYVVGGTNLSKIDPTGTMLIYSVNFTGVSMAAVTTDPAGNAYVTGSGTVAGKGSEVQVAKMNATGTALFFWVSFGGALEDGASDIAIDGSNNVLVAGTSHSANFPVFNAFQPTLRGPGDAFVTKLSAAGNQILYSTYLGGNSSDFGQGIAADAAGNAWVAGTTTTDANGVTSFPATSGAAQFFSGGGDSDGIIAKFNTMGGLVYATYVGGASRDDIYGIAVDASTGSAYVTGYTFSTNYPVRGSAFQPTYGGGLSDAVITQINSTGSSFVYSTYLGGTGSDNGFRIAVDASRNVYATGSTASSNFPSNVYPQAGSWDAYITKFFGP